MTILQCILLVGLILLAPISAEAASIAGKVTRVIDGDTVDILQGQTTVRVRLNGIDAPERGQAYGRKARQFVLNLAAQKMVTVEIVDKDRYGRSVGDVMLPDGRNLNQEIIKAGYAWWYRKYSRNQILGQLEKEARLARRGLWQAKNPMPPWEWRKLKRENGSKLTQRQFLKP